MPHWQEDKREKHCSTALHQTRPGRHRPPWNARRNDLPGGVQRLSTDGSVHTTGWG